MSRRCVVTGKKVITGNNVSHSHRKTRRTFDPNIQKTSLYSEALGRNVRVKISASGLRTVDHKGGLDTWLVNTAPSKLDPDMRPIRQQVIKALEAKHGKIEPKKSTRPAKQVSKRAEKAKAKNAAAKKSA